MNSRRAMLVFENHVVIQRIEGRYNRRTAACHSADHDRYFAETVRGGGCAEKEENADEEAEENTAD
ncbi:MAG: hypothetical protein ACLR4Z_11330 [Butyricicoccaceae bacterium]